MKFRDRKTETQISAEVKAKLNFRYGKDKSTLLHIAARRNMTKIVKLLITWGADPNIVNINSISAWEESFYAYSIDIALILKPLSQLTHNYVLKINKILSKKLLKNINWENITAEELKILEFFRNYEPILDQAIKEILINIKKIIKIKI